MPFVFIGYGVPEEFRTAIECRGFSTVRLPCFSGLDKPVSSHPDILLFPLKGRILISKRYYEENSELLSQCGDIFDFTDECPASPYPKDVLFDVVKIGNSVIGKRGSVSSAITDVYPLIHVNQGYAGCSTAKISENAFITADSSIASALRKQGGDVLEITPGGIALDGYDCGFIGGAGGRLPNGEYMFFGDPETHQNGGEILDFLKKHKIKAVTGQGLLHDYGGIIFAD